MRDWAKRVMAVGMAIAMLPGYAQNGAQSSAQTPQQNSQQVSSDSVSSTPQAGFTLKMNGELVLTNVVARDAKTGEVVKGLKQSDFKIYENGKQQHIETFDFQSVDMATPL